MIILIDQYMMIYGEHFTTVCFVPTTMQAATLFHTLRLTYTQ